MVGGAAGTSSAGIVFDVQAVYAGFWRRAWSVALDVLFDGVVAAVLFGYTDGVISWLLFVSFLVVHHVGLSAEGGTIGKRVLGLRIVQVDGSRMTLPRAALRELVRVTASTLSLGLGYLWMLDNRQRQTWHDIAGGTVVVRELRAEPGPPWRFNPPWVVAAMQTAPQMPAPLGAHAMAPPPPGAEPVPVGGRSREDESSPELVDQADADQDSSPADPPNRVD